MLWCHWLLVRQYAVTAKKSQEGFTRLSMSALAG